MAVQCVFYEEETEFINIRSPVSRRRLRKGNRVPGVCIYGDLALQVGAVANLRQ
jgi:hypothetical protein